MVELGTHLAYRKSACWKLSAYSCARRRFIPTIQLHSAPLPQRIVRACSFKKSCIMMPSGSQSLKKGER